MKTPTLLVSITYSEITPESAEHGDFSDSGFVSEGERVGFRELVDLILSRGFYREGKTEWLTTGYSTHCYRTGTEREECLHFDRENPPRLRKYFELAVKAVENRRKARK